MHFFRFNAKQQGIQAGNHQPLDVVCVTMLKRLLNRIPHTSHVGCACPVKTGEWGIGLHFVAIYIAWHLAPVDATNKFSPT